MDSTLTLLLSCGCKVGVLQDEAHPWYVGEPQLCEDESHGDPLVEVTAITPANGSES